VQTATEAAGLCLGDTALHVGRHFSLRDVLKWCKRMKVVHHLVAARPEWST
jgi:midasin